MRRKPIIAANWKMHNGPSETTEFLKTFLGRLDHATDYCDVVIAPPFVSLTAAAHALESSPVSLAAQNVSQHDHGAYTGETSAMMLKQFYMQYVIVGHSERRSLYHETDQIINAKVLKLREMNLKPIFCIGETLEQRNSGQLETTLRQQILGGLDTIDDKDLLDIVIAYEPVWAIGTGVTATPQQAQDTHHFVRSILAEQYSPDLAEKVRIQYGGSVKPNNAAELLSQPDIDGALVGGASLDPIAFLDIIRSCNPNPTGE